MQEKLEKDKPRQIISPDLIFESIDVMDVTEYL